MLSALIMWQRARVIPRPTSDWHYADGGVGCFGLSVGSLSYGCVRTRGRFCQTLGAVRFAVFTTPQKARGGTLLPLPLLGRRPSGARLLVSRRCVQSHLLCWTNKPRMITTCSLVLGGLTCFVSLDYHENRLRIRHRYTY